MKKILEYPYDWNEILRKSREIRDYLLNHSEGLISKKIAIMGGSTTSHIKTILELFCLKKGIRPDFYESNYGKYYEEIIFDDEKFYNFNPDIILIHTNFFNLTHLPSINDNE